MKNDDQEKKYYTVSKVSYTIRVFVALYLYYTVWQIKDAPFKSEGMERVVFIIAIILFLVCATVIGYTSMKALIRKEYSENNPQEDTFAISEPEPKAEQEIKELTDSEAAPYEETEPSEASEDEEKAQAEEVSDEEKDKAD